MGLNDTPSSSRFTVGIFGKRNAGKSSLINAITEQEIAVTSEIAGTTTDPVYKAMELLPIGPIMLIDTAGLDDDSELGNLRIEKSYEALRKCNLTILVTDINSELSKFEIDFINEMSKRKIPCILVLNKCDKGIPDKETVKKIVGDIKIPFVCTCAKNNDGIEKLKQLIVDNSNLTDIEPGLTDGLIEKNDVAILVTPIDSSAPKGRMILPQQQTMRDILDKDAICFLTKETELNLTLKSLAVKPKIVITDSQAFAKVSKILPSDIPLTSFSILFARQKGDIRKLLKGIDAIKSLKDGDKVLIVEGCTHHRKSDDIGTVKIPNFIRKLYGKNIEFDWASGAVFPKDVSNYSVIIHCGACMLNSKEMQYRIDTAFDVGVPITNYGMVLAHVTGILDRAIKPLDLW